MRAEGNLIGEEVAVGEIVTPNRLLPQQYRLNTNDRFDVNTGEQLQVTRVENESLVVRTMEFKSVRDTSQYGAQGRVQKQVSFRIGRLFLMFEDPNYVPPPPPRKLGTVPSDTPTMRYVSIDDPGIQWLFDDMGVYAEKEGYCSQYDALCAKLGIPGRPRDFTVHKTLNGIDVRATIRARSQREANEAFALAIATPTE